VTLDKFKGKDFENKVRGFDFGGATVIGYDDEGGIKTPNDFLDYHQQRAGYRGMRGSIREIETDLNYDQFGQAVLQDAIEREGNAASN